MPNLKKVFEKIIHFCCGFSAFLFENVRKYKIHGKTFKT